MDEKPDLREFWKKIYLSECVEMINANQINMMSNSEKEIENCKDTGEAYFKIIDAFYLTEDLIKGGWPPSIKIYDENLMPVKKAKNPL